MSDQEPKPTAPPEGGFKKRIAARVCEAILATEAGVGHDAENRFANYTYASADAVYAHSEQGDCGSRARRPRPRS